MIALPFICSKLAAYKSWWPGLKIATHTIPVNRTTSTTNWVKDRNVDALVLKPGRR